MERLGHEHVENRKITGKNCLVLVQRIVIMDRSSNRTRLLLVKLRENLPSKTLCIKIRYLCVTPSRIAQLVIHSTPKNRESANHNIYRMLLKNVGKMVSWITYNKGVGRSCKGHHGKCVESRTRIRGTEEKSPYPTRDFLYLAPLGAEESFASFIKGT